MPARSHVIRTLLLVGLCALLLAPRAEAGHRRLFADLDADGRRDHVTVDTHEPWIVRIWLSATRSTHIIRSPQPLRGITVVDLNGDRRPELIFSNRSHGLQVWTSAPGGFVAYPHRPRPPTDDISGSTRHRVDDQSDELPPGIAGAGATLVVAMTSLNPWAAVPETRHTRANHPRDGRSTFRLAPLSPRPPPILI
jgi:hypothetical protein